MAMQYLLILPTPYGSSGSGTAYLDPKKKVNPLRLAPIARQAKDPELHRFLISTETCTG